MTPDESVPDILREILKWTRFQGMLQAKEVLEHTLQTRTERLMYHLSDGKTSREIGETVGVDKSTVTKTWKRWNSLGIVEPIPVKGGGFRYVRVFNLEDFGIDVPNRP